MSENLDTLSYKELQEIAKKCVIPANFRREVLVKSINAYYQKDDELLRRILEEEKNAREIRKSEGKPVQRKRKLKNNNHVNIKLVPKSKPADEVAYDTIDSTSENVENVISYNRFLEFNKENGRSVINQNKSLDRFHSGQHSALMLNNDQRWSECDQSATNAFATSPFQPNYTTSPVVSYNSPLQKDHAYNSNFHAFHGNAFYRQSCAPLEWMGKSSQFFPSHEEFYPAQLPASKLFEPKVLLPFDGLNYTPELPNTSSTSQNVLCDNESGGLNTPSMMVNCPADLLPNVPQLEAITENQINVSVAFTQSGALSAYPQRIEFSSTPQFSNQEGATRDEYNCELFVDNESINAEIDSTSNVDSAALSDDIVNLLDLDNMGEELKLDSRLLMSNLSQNIVHGSGQSSSVVSSDYSYHVNSTSSYEKDADLLGSFSEKKNQFDYNQNVEGYAGTCSENPDFQFSTFLGATPDVKQSVPSNGIRRDHQLSLQQPYDLSCLNSSMTPSNAAMGSCVSLCAEPAVIEFVNGSPFVDEDDVRRNRFANTDYPYAISSTQTNAILNPVSRPVALTHELSSSSLSYSSQSTTASANNGDVVDLECDKNLALEMLQNDLRITSSIPKDLSDTTSLIYEKETLHRSQIICNTSKMKNGISENIMREVVHVYVPKDNCKKIIRQSSKLNTIAEVFAPMHEVFKSASFFTPNIRGCMYKSSGCNFQAQTTVVLNHEKRCKFQPITCPSESCSWTDSIDTLSRHINDSHTTEIRCKQQFLYTIDRTQSESDGLFYTFYQVYCNTIYVIRLHIDEDKCVATVQYIPEVEGDVFKNKIMKGVMEVISFPNKRRVLTWKGSIYPYSDNTSKYQKYNTIQIDINGSEFIALYVYID